MLKNSLIITLVFTICAISAATPTYAKPIQNSFETSYDQNDFQKESKSFEISLLPSSFLSEDKPLNTENLKLERKPINKKLYKKIKRFLQRKKIRRKRRIVVHNLTPSQLQSQIG